LRPDIRNQGAVVEPLPGSHDLAGARTPTIPSMEYRRCSHSIGLSDSLVRRGPAFIPGKPLLPMNTDGAPPMQVSPGFIERDAWNLLTIRLLDRTHRRFPLHSAQCIMHASSYPPPRAFSPSTAAASPLSTPTIHVPGHPGFRLSRRRVRHHVHRGLPPPPSPAHTLLR
jgi:hypothetical protein